MRSDAPAVVCGSEVLTYADLAARSDDLAARLHLAGIGPEDVVAVSLPRGVALPVALLGVLKSGAAFLPLQADLPVRRAQAIHADARVRAVITDLDDHQGRSCDLPDPDPLSAAYVIYTSGSTGTPKGVVVPHGAMGAHLRAMASRLRVGPRDTVLQMAGESVDVAVEQFFLALSSGATVLMRGPEPWGTSELRRALSQVTIADVPAALFAELMAEQRPIDLGRLRVLLVGGEQVQVNAARRWSGPTLLNAYGPTEAVVTASLHPVTAVEGDRVPIGRRVGARRLLVLDGQLRRVREGELYIGGEILARGYLNRPALTADRFVPDPFGPPGSRLYRTGDRVLRRGALEFIGRVDDQVKVRGHRVELGEVESVLAAHPLVDRCAVVAGQDRLAAHVVTSETVDGLREWMAQRVPVWMVPGEWHRHERLPVTSAGKVDRAALPYQRMELAGEGEPRTPAERALVRIWCEVLGLTRVGRHDDFFRLGGTSIGAIRVLAGFRAATGIDLELRDVFESPTVAGLAACAPRTGLAALVPAGRGPREMPLSLTQEQIWFLEQLEPGNIAYHAPTTFRLAGPLDHARLEAAVTGLVERHEILRTTFACRRDGTPVQRIHDPYPVRIAVLDAAPDEVDNLVLAQARIPFDLSLLPLARWTLLRITPELHELVLVEHHLIHDGWSFALLAGELGARYRGDDPGPARLQYGDFVHWQRHADLSGQRAYWLERLRGAVNDPWLISTPFG